MFFREINSEYDSFPNDQFDGIFAKAICETNEIITIVQQKYIEYIINAFFPNSDPNIVYLSRTFFVN